MKDHKLVQPNQPILTINGNSILESEISSLKERRPKMSDMIKVEAVCPENRNIINDPVSCQTCSKCFKGSGLTGIIIVEIDPDQPVIRDYFKSEWNKKLEGLTKKMNDISKMIDRIWDDEPHTVSIGINKIIEEINKLKETK